jgi:hypothetical protein
VRPIWPWFLIFSLSGCSLNHRSVFISPEAITSPIYGLKGSSLDAASAYLGPPDSDINLDSDHRVVIWRRGEDDASPHVNGSSTGLYGNHSSPQAPRCTIKAVVRADGKIESVEIDSNSAYYCPRGSNPAVLRGSL